MKKVFYERVTTGSRIRYKPVKEYDSELMDAMHKGTHIVMSYPGGRSTRYNIDPAFGPMIAAGRFAEEYISRHIMEVSGLRAQESRKPVTEEQRVAWEALKAAFGDEQYPLEYCSYREAAEAGVKAMQIEAEKMLENPSVRRAWNNFMLIWQLTKEQDQ